MTSQTAISPRIAHGLRAADMAMSIRRQHAELPNEQHEIAKRRRLVRIQQAARRRSAGLYEARMHVGI